MHSEADREKVLGFRKQQRSFKEIHDLTGVPKSTIAHWLRGQPLAPDELKRRLAANGKNAVKLQWALAQSPSKLFALTKARPLSNSDKARISETAVLLRLTLIGFPPFTSPFDGDSTDWVIQTSGGFRTLQVKWATRGKYGAPYVRLMCANGRGCLRRYELGEVDFFAGYDLYTDIACVWTAAEVGAQRTVSFSDEAVERWDKLK